MRLLNFFKHEYFKIFCVISLTVFGAYFSASYSVAPNAGTNLAYGATGASGTGSFNNHTLFAGAAPAVTNCGVGASVAVSSSDNAGTVTIGATTTTNLGQVIPVLQCTLTWATAFTTAPSAGITMVAGSGRRYGVGNINPSIAANTTTATTYYFDSDAALAVFTYSAF